MPTVFANGRSIVHAGDGQVNTSAPPDVCKTPSPAGPVPIPYVNVAKSSDLADGTKSVKIEGNSVAVEGSNLSTSTGDEPGTAGGIISSKTKGKLTWQTRSLDVKFEGKGVVRFGDVTLHNGNTFNTAFMQNGGTGFAYGDDFKGKCPICEKSPDKHRVLETKDCSGEIDTLIQALTDAHRKYVDRLDNLEKTISDLEVQKALRNSHGSELVNRHRELRLEQEKWMKDYGKAGGDERLKTASAERAALKPILRNGKGYMVGLLICSGGKKFAAMSGPDATGFEEVARENNWTPCLGQVTFEEAVAASPRIVGAKAKAFQKSWNATEASFVHDKKQFNLPGNCAAQKLAVKAVDEKGVRHKPGKPLGAMSERWFAPDEPERRVKVRYRGALAHSVLVQETKVRFLRLSIAKFLNWAIWSEAFKHADTVPSCGTCQVLLPMMLCDLDSKCC